MPSTTSRLAVALALSLALHGGVLLLGRQPQKIPGDASAPRSQTTLQLRTLPPSAAPAQAPTAPPEARDTGTAAATASKPSPRTAPSSFVPAEQLTRLPRLLSPIDLDIPQARLLDAPGKLVLTLWIGADGQVVAFHVHGPDLPEEYTTAVAEVFGAARFSPGERHGQRVGTILPLEIRHGEPLASPLSPLTPTSPPHAQ